MAIGLFTRARDIVVVQDTGPIITADDARAGLRLAGTDEDGLGPVHRRILKILAQYGHPLAVRRLADWAGISVGAFRTFYEAALMLSGWIVSTPRGIAITPAGLARSARE